MLTALSRFVDASILSRIEAVLSRPEARALMEAERVKTHEQRLADIAERDGLHRELVAVHERWAPKVADAERRTETAKWAYDEALADLNSIRASSRAEAFDVDTRYSRAREHVYQSAAPEPFAAFEKRCDAALEATQKKSDHITEGLSDPRIRPHRVWDNDASVFRRMEAITQSRIDARELRHEALTDAELEQRFEALVATWPEVEARPSKFDRE